MLFRGLGILLLAVLTGCSTMTERSMLDRIEANKARLSQVWMGYDAEQRRLGFIDSDKFVYLKADELPDNDFIEVEKGLWKSEKAYAQFNGLFHINAQITPEVRATLVEAGARKNYLALSALILHEDFHGFQREHFVDNRSDTLAYADIGELPPYEVFAAVRFERRLLQSILERFDETDVRNDRITSYVAHRNVRSQLMPESFSINENAIERSEGTATWFEFYAMKELGFLHDVTPVMIRRLQSSSEEIGGDLSARFFSQRLYGTGAAISDIVHRLSIPNWQQAIKLGKSPFDILNEHYAVSTDIALQTYKVLQTSQAYRDELTASKRFEIPIQPLQRLNNIAEEYAFKVTFELDNASRDEFDYGFAAKQIVSLPEGLLLPNIYRFNASADNVRISVEGENVLLHKTASLSSELGVSKSTFALFVDTIKIDDKALSLGSYSARAEDIEATGCQFEGEGNIRITVEKADVELSKIKSDSVD